MLEQPKFMMPDLWAPQMFAQGMELAQNRQRIEMAQKAQEIQMRQWEKDFERLQRLDSFSQTKFAYEQGQDAIANNFRTGEFGVSMSNLQMRQQEGEQRKEEHESGLKQQDEMRNMIRGFVMPALPGAQAPPSMQSQFPGSQSSQAPVIQSNPLFPGYAPSTSSSPYGPPDINITAPGMSARFSPKQEEAAAPVFTSDGWKKYLDNQRPGSTHYGKVIDDESGALASAQVTIPQNPLEKPVDLAAVQRKIDSYREKLVKEEGKTDYKGNPSKEQNKTLIAYYVEQIKLLEQSIATGGAVKPPDDEPPPETNAGRAYKSYYGE